MGRNKKKRKRKKKSAYCFWRAALIALMGIAGMVAVFGIVTAMMYQTGRAGIKAAGGKGPRIEATDRVEELAAKQKAQLAAVPWQEGWTVMDGKVYEYNGDAINLLFLGIDKPGTLSSRTSPGNWETGQADAIFVVSLNPVDREIRLVGIPRNSMVELRIYDESGACVETMYNQLCLQYGYAGGGKEGLAQVKETVSELFLGLPIHGAMAVGYDAVTLVNDRIGGVTVEVLEDMQKADPVLKEGARVRLTGKTVLQYVKWRDVSELGSPTKRLQRQKQYIMALFGVGKEQVAQKPGMAVELYNLVSPYMNTDIGLDEAVYLAAEALQYRFDASSFYLLQGEDRAVAFTDKDGKEDFYDDYYLDEENIRQTMKEVFYREVVLDEEMSNKGY